MENLIHWPGRSIYYKILRDGKAFFSVSTFYNYCKWLGFSKKREKYKKKYEPLRAKRPFEKLHMDVTIMRPRTREAALRGFVVCKLCLLSL